MGIRGLTTYIEKHSRRYLKPYQLHNCYLVIDGNNLASHIYKWICKSYSVFGGDYHEFRFYVETFFKNLEKCNIQAIVIIDGGYEYQKIPTVKDRMKSKLISVRHLQSMLQSRLCFFPLFMRHTFIAILQEMKIPHAQCDFEADNEIAVIARILKCPVLSYDSDFFIFDVLYIPFGSLVWDPVLTEESSYYMNCSIYDVQVFLANFKGLTVEELPLIATILGNDYVNSKIFSKFLSHVHKSKSKSETPTEQKIVGILNWMKNETVETAMNTILLHLRNRDAGKVTAKINQCISNYKCTSSTILNTLNQQYNLPLQDDETTEQSNTFSSTFKTISRQCLLPSFMTDMITLKTYFLVPQAEDTSQSSAHIISNCLIEFIFHILNSKAKKLKLVSREKGHIKEFVLEVERPLMLQPYETFDQIYNLPLPNRLEMIYELCELTDEDKKLLKQFPENCILYFISLIYWSKKVQATCIDLYSFIISFISLNIVQSKLGYYRTKQKFLQHKGGFYNKLIKSRSDLESKSEIPTSTLEQSLTNNLNSVTEDDCLIIAPFVISLHQVDEKLKAMPKQLDTSIIHSYAIFQSHLYHLVYLNALLGFPFSPFTISDFYSGTLLYNMHMSLKAQTNLKEYVSSLFSLTPTLNVLFQQFITLLTPYFSPVTSLIKKRVKRRKKKSAVVAQNTEDISQSNAPSESSDWEDENNRFAMLSITNS